VVVAAAHHGQTPEHGDGLPGGTDLLVIRLDDGGSPTTPPRTVLSHRGNLMVNGVALSTEGDVHVVGMVTGPLIEGATVGIDPGSGGFVAGRWPFIARFDPHEGPVIWVVQFGSLGGSTAHGPAVDAACHVWVAGGYHERHLTDAPDTWTAYIRKHAADGSVAWVREAAHPEHAVVFGGVASSPLAWAAVVAAMHTGSASAHETEAHDPVSTDAFVQVYAADGDVLWTRPLRTGTGFRGVVNVAVDAAEASSS